METNDSEALDYNKMDITDIWDMCNSPVYRVGNENVTYPVLVRYVTDDVWIYSGPMVGTLFIDTCQVDEFRSIYDFVDVSNQEEEPLTVKIRHLGLSMTVSCLQCGHDRYEYIRVTSDQIKIIWSHIDHGKDANAKIITLKFKYDFKCPECGSEFSLSIGDDLYTGKISDIRTSLKVVLPKGDPT